ncbi:hypothetical protein IR083_10490 [Dysgonomonas sp. GY75]|uniref:hypothetical protein n=1 Tax=Dysgonomonas sp. GY75 TaxID=2780419 RepID=UPI001883E49A|nr:hypothetical protein [Dysgonomonas sp. GY75]MBF0649248.1 hypothetical protein [Dysgonomonas sp. GY75]
MSFFKDTDDRWKGRRIRLKEGHPRAGETAVFSHILNGYDGFGLVFESDEGKPGIFIRLYELDLIEIIPETIKENI